MAAAGAALAGGAFGTGVLEQQSHVAVAGLQATAEQ
jgi:hypothetical protein